jgi:hypothetical protein
MLRLLVYLIPIGLAIYALIDCIQTPDDQVRGLPKIGWIVLIVLIWLVGPVAWLIAGRQRGAGRTPAAGNPGGTGSGYAPGGRPGRVIAPDDDPEFLSQLGRSPAPSSEDEMLAQWEEDLRRRERDLRGDSPGDEDDGTTGPRS